MTRNQDRVRFGDYSFVLSLGLLERDSYSVTLPEQATKVLVQLLEHGGELVTRDALCANLWPSTTVSEADQGINNVVSRLRWYLRDNAQKPRYIETIPKRGYRFLEKIESDPDLKVCLPSSPAAEPPEALAAFEIAVTRAEPAGPEHTSFQSRYIRALTVTLCLLLLAGGLAVIRRLRTARSEEHALTTIAIGPFQTESTDPVASQLADSLRLDLMNLLSQLPAIQVKASEAFPSLTATNEQQTASFKRLGVDEVLFVQLRRNAGNYLIDLELDKADGLNHIASWQYKGSGQQLNSIMQQARDDIFSSSRGHGQHRPPHGGTNVPEAYELYLQARYHAHQRLADPLREAVEEYQQAIRLDPEFANAYAGLADAYVALSDYSVENQSHAYILAQDAVKHAIALDPSLAEAQALFGYISYRKDWNFVDGEAHLRQAIHLDDAQARYHLWLSIILTQQRRFSEAAQEIERAKEDDPFWAAVYGDEAYLEANLHEFVRLNHTIDTLIGLEPNWSGSYDDRAWAYWLSGHKEQAIAEWRRMAIMDRDTKRIALEDRGRSAFRSGGIRAYARIRYEAATSGISYMHAGPDFNAAEWAAYMGDYNLTLHILDQMVSRHDSACLEMSIDSAFIPLYSSQDFLDLLEKVHLPSPHSSNGSMGPAANNRTSFEGVA